MTDLHGENSLLYDHAFRLTCWTGCIVVHHAPLHGRRHMRRRRVRRCCLLPVLLLCICRLRMLEDARLLARRLAGAQGGAICYCLCIPAWSAVNGAQPLQNIAVQPAAPRKCIIFLVGAGCRQQVWQALKGIRRQGLSETTVPHSASVMTPIRLVWRRKQRHCVRCHTTEPPSHGPNSPARQGEAGLFWRGRGGKGCRVKRSSSRGLLRTPY